MKNEQPKGVDVGVYRDKHTNVLRVANNRFKTAMKKHEDFVKTAKQCEDFVFGEQWSPEDRKENEDNGKPVLTINISLSTINAIYKEYSSISSDITTKAKGKAVQDESVILNKVIKGVMSQNNYSDQEIDMFIDGITSGRSWVSVVLSDEEDPLGAIQLKVEDYNNIVLSPDASDYDPDEWPELFYFDEFTRDEIEELFGKDKSDYLDYSLNEDLGTYDYLKNLRTFGEGEDNYDNGEDPAWDKVIVVTREWYEYTDSYTFVDPETTDYEVVPRSDFEDEEEAKTLAKENFLTLYKSRMKRIKYARFCGTIMLETDWLPYKHYSKIPFFAYFAKGRSMGVMQNLISPQQQLNKGESQELHIVNSTSNGGWQGEEDALVNMTPEELERKGAKTGLVIIRRRGTQPLEKIHPNQVPTGISNLGNKAAVNLLRVAGVNEAQLGITKTNDSGSLVEKKKDAGQGLLQRVFDNLRRTQKLIGRAIVDIVQEYYTEPRVLRFTSNDGEVPEEVAINQVNAANRIVNDVSIGRYDIAITWAPKADVLNDHEFDKLVRMREAGFEIPQWLVVEKSQLTDKQMLVKHLRRAAGLDKTPEEQQLEQTMQQIAIAKAQLELQELQSKIQVNQSVARRNMADAQDTLVGQNERFLIQTVANRESDMLNAQLRSDLAGKSNDATITKTLLNNAAKEQQQTPQLGKPESEKDDSTTQEEGE